MNKNTVIITSVGMVIGIAEALLYYNLGQSAGGKLTYKIPPTKEFLKTAGLVLLTSILTAGISGFIESRFQEDKRQTA